MALDQNRTVAEVLGIKPVGSTQSWNEILWWGAYRAIVPTHYDRLATMESRIVGLHTGKSPAQVYLDPWSNFRNPEWLKAEADDLKKIVAENKKKAKEKQLNG